MLSIPQLLGFCLLQEQYKEDLKNNYKKDECDYFINECKEGIYDELKCVEKCINIMCDIKNIELIKYNEEIKDKLIEISETLEKHVNNLKELSDVFKMIYNNKEVEVK